MPQANFAKMEHVHRTLLARLVGSETTTLEHSIDTQFPDKPPQMRAALSRSLNDRLKAQALLLTGVYAIAEKIRTGIVHSIAARTHDKIMLFYANGRRSCYEPLDTIEWPTEWRFS